MKAGNLERGVTDMDYETATQQSKLSAAVCAEEHMLVATLKPKFGIDGNMFFFLYGNNLQEGIAGFGATPYAAVIDFNKNWLNYTLERKQK